MCGLVDMVEKKKKGGVGFSSLSLPFPVPLAPSRLSCAVFIFSPFLRSWLSLHGWCHILVTHSSKLIRDDARLMETFPQSAVFVQPPPPPPHPTLHLRLFFCTRPNSVDELLIYVDFIYTSPTIGMRTKREAAVCGFSSVSIR